MLDIRKLFYKAGSLLKEQHDALEKTKVGTLRVGNTGLFDRETGVVAGNCMRKTFLRQQGIEVPEEDNGAIDQTLMFEAGVTNEDSWAERLRVAWNDEHLNRAFLRESEVPVRWTTSNGTVVTGRPDFVLTENDIYVYGLELKLMSSLWTVRDILTGSPKTPHLMQAAHYSWQLGIDFSLCYTLRADMAVLGFATKLFPKQSQEGSQYCEYNERDGAIKKVKPFMKEFKLTWEKVGTADTLVYTDTDTKITKTSIVTVERIKDYFEHTSLLANAGPNAVLPPRPTNLNPDGTKGGYAICDYCQLKSTCDTHEEQGIRSWLEQAQRAAKKLG